MSSTILKPQSGALESGRVAPPSSFKRWETEAEVPLHYSIIGHFMVYQDRIGTNLL